MKETIKWIIDNYGTDKIHYSVIIYGARAIEFRDIEVRLNSAILIYRSLIRILMSPFSLRISQALQL